MTEDEALERVDSIGQAFDNDYNDGDGPAYEGLHTAYNKAGDLLLVYVAQLFDEDNEDELVTETFYWKMEAVEYED